MASLSERPSAVSVTARDESKRDGAAQLAAYVAKVVAEAPPLTPDQLAHVAALLTPRSRAA